MQILHYNIGSGNFYCLAWYKIGLTWKKLWYLACFRWFITMMNLLSDFWLQIYDKNNIWNVIAWLLWPQNIVREQSEHCTVYTTFNVTSSGYATPFFYHMYTKVDVDFNDYNTSNLNTIIKHSWSVMKVIVCGLLLCLM